MNISRREFAGGLLAAGGFWALPGCHLSDEKTPHLRFGVISDIHIGGRKAAQKRLRFALRRLAAQNVDAVLSPGDITHSGLIREMEEFASIWNETFTNGRGPDGREVKLLIATGNHEAAATWVKGAPEWRAANVLSERDNFPRVWERLFHEKWELVWKREVKGYSFIGAQWRTLNPPLEAFMAEHGKELDPTKPFFFCQHAHPLGTCHKGFTTVFDDGKAGRALKAFPNAVAFTGHSHATLADERAVWQGTFTSIGAGCLHEGGATFSYDNISAHWHPDSLKHLMGALNDPEAWGGDPDGGCFEMVDVFSDHLRVQRRSSVWDLPIGPDWLVPLPATAKGPFDFGTRMASRQAPAFAADATVTVEDCPAGHPLEGKKHRGEPCVYVSFPAAKPVGGCRVFDYVVTAIADGKPVKTLTIFAPDAVLPEAKAGRRGECLFARKYLPTGHEITFSIIPRECFGKAGRPLTGRLN